MPAQNAALPHEVGRSTAPKAERNSLELRIGQPRGPSSLGRIQPATHALKERVSSDLPRIFNNLR
jgi:hypothetical protein